MYSRGVVVPILILIFQLLTTGLAIQCYQCEQKVDSDSQCLKNVRNVLSANCTGSFGCIKYFKKEANITTIHRNCAPQSKCEELRAEMSNQTILYCGTCNSTLCNSATVSKSSWIYLSCILFSSFLKTLV